MSREVKFDPDKIDLTDPYWEVWPDVKFQSWEPIRLSKRVRFSIEQRNLNGDLFVLDTYEKAVKYWCRLYDESFESPPIAGSQFQEEKDVWVMHIHSSERSLYRVRGTLVPEYQAKEYLAKATS